MRRSEQVFFNLTIFVFCRFLNLINTLKVKLKQMSYGLELFFKIQKRIVIILVCVVLKTLDSYIKIFVRNKMQKEYLKNKLIKTLMPNSTGKKTIVTWLELKVLIFTSVLLSLKTFFIKKILWCYDVYIIPYKIVKPYKPLVES